MTYTQVWLHSGDGFKLDPSDVSRIDAAVSLWKAEQRDTLISTVTTPGDELYFCASDVAWWHTSTPETRERAIQMEVALEDEDRANRVAAGRWEDE